MFPRVKTRRKRFRRRRTADGSRATASGARDGARDASRRDALFRRLFKKKRSALDADLGGSRTSWTPKFGPTGASEVSALTAAVAAAPPRARARSSALTFARGAARSASPPGASSALRTVPTAGASASRWACAASSDMLGGGRGTSSRTLGTLRAGFDVERVLKCAEERPVARINRRRSQQSLFARFHVFTFSRFHPARVDTTSGVTTQGRIAEPERPILKSTALAAVRFLLRKFPPACARHTRARVVVADVQPRRHVVGGGPLRRKAAFFASCRCVATPHRASRAVFRRAASGPAHIARRGLRSNFRTPLPRRSP